MQDLRATRIVMCLAAAVSCAALGARLCLPAQAFSQDSPGQGMGLVWPSPPTRPVIRYVSSVAGPDQASARGSLFSRLGKLLSGTSREGLVRPLGVAANRGILYVTDPGGHALLIFDQEQKSFQRIRKADNANLESPVGVAAGKDRVFLADSSLKQIFVYDRRGKFLRKFTDQQPERPTGLAVDEKSGKLYVADTAAHQVRIYSNDGVLEKVLGKRGTGKGEFNYPTNLWLDGDGSLCVVDSLNYRVQIFGPDGSFLTEFGHQGDSSGAFASPKGIAADSSGHIYVVDALFDAVQIFDRQGQLLLSFGERGTGPGQFWLPSGISIDERNRIYVADSYNQRIQVFEFLGGPDHGE